MTNRHKAQVGTVSAGTLRTEDLLKTLGAELEYLAKGESHPGNRQNYAEVAAEALADTSTQTDVYNQDTLDDVFNCLNELAPPYCYFGSHPGDGADFGFWPDMDTIEELPRVSDPGEVRIADHDWLFVNDHGNVTVYSGNTLQPVLEIV